MIQSILSNWAATIISAIISLLLTPILVRGLGDLHYGMFVFVASLVDYSSFIDLGMRTTLLRFVGRAQAMQEREGLDETLSTTMVLAFSAAGLICVLNFVLARILPGFFGLTGSANALFAKLIVLLGLSVAVAFPSRALSAYLCGLQRFDLFNFSSIATIFVRACLFVGVLHWGYGVVGCSVVNLGMSAAALVLNWFLVRHADPQLAVGWNLVSWQRARAMLRFGAYVFVSTMGDFLRFRIDSFVIARWLVLSLVTPFNLATRLIDYFRSVMSAVAQPLVPTMSGLDGQAREKDLQIVFLRFTRLMALLSLFIASMLWLNGKSLFVLWVGSAYASAYLPLAVLLMGHMTSMAQSPSLALLFAKGRIRPIAWWSLGEGVLNFALSIYWAREYGLVGVALGTAVPQIFVKLTLQPWTALRAIDLTAKDYVLQALARPLAVCGLFFTLTRLIGSAPAPVGLSSFLWTVAWQTALFGLLAYSIGMASADRQLLWIGGRRVASTLGLVRAE